MMTWQELKAELERQGVKDEDEIIFIDVAAPVLGHIDVEFVTPGEPYNRRVMVY